MHKTISILILVAYLLQSCRSSALFSKIDEHCKDKFPCRIDMIELFAGSWDTMYVFKPTASLEEMNQALGFSYPYFQDIAERIVLVKNKQVIYHEDHFPSFENPEKNAVIFDIGDSLKYKLYNREQAKFFVRKMSYGADSYFKLTD